MTNNVVPDSYHYKNKQRRARFSCMMRTAAPCRTVRYVGATAYIVTTRQETGIASVTWCSGCALPASPCPLRHAYAAAWIMMAPNTNERVGAKPKSTTWKSQLRKYALTGTVEASCTMRAKQRDGGTPRPLLHFAGLATRGNQSEQ